VIRRAAILLLLALSPALAHATDADQPPFEVPGAAATENFRNAFLGIDQANVALSSHTSNINVLISSVAAINAASGSLTTVGNTTCIDSPTLCVDTANHRVGVANTTPATKFVLSSGTLSIDGSLPNNRAITSSGDIVISTSVSGSSVLLTLQNNSNTAGSGARLAVLVGGGTGDDPWALFQVAGVTSWSAGIDNSDSDRFKISNSATLGSGDYLIIDPTATSVSVHGTNTNDSASSGFVGEQVESRVNATSFPTTGNWGDLTSISLTAGDWDVTATYDANANGATVSDILIGISTTTGNSTAGLIVGYTRLANAGPTATNHSSMALPNYRATLSGSFTMYLKYSADFSVATPQAAGRISARRKR
jgi:hypothetical protein